MIKQYKFENFENPNFPVYSSTQIGDGVLVVPHFHGEAEIVMITSGNVEVIIDAINIRCKAGDIIFFPPYSFHSVRSVSGTSSLDGVVYELGLTNANIPDINLHEIFNKERITEFVVDKESDIYNELLASFSGVISAYSCDRYTAKMDLLSSLYHTTAVLAEKYNSSSNDESNAIFKRIKPAIDYINENYNKKIYICELGALLHVCDDYIIRLFKAVTNKSPMQYVLDKRTQEAMKLLINTNLPMYDISEKVGFSNANYMSGVLKSSIGMSPIEYRKKLREKI